MILILYKPNFSNFIMKCISSLLGIPFPTKFYLQPFSKPRGMPPEIKANERIFLLVQFQFSVGSNLWRGTTRPCVSQVRENRWVWMLAVSPTSCLSFIRLRFMFSAHLFFSLFPEEIRQIYIMVNKLSLSEGRQEGKKTDLVSVGGRDVEN